MRTDLEPWFLAYGGPGHLVFREGVKDEGNDSHAPRVPVDGSGESSLLAESDQLDNSEVR